LFAGAQRNERRYDKNNTADSDGCLPHATIQPGGTRRLHFRPPLHLVLEKAFSEKVFKEGFPQLDDSNNPLAVELERENDPTRENFSGEPL
jgi:hypothetical protein